MDEPGALKASNERRPRFAEYRLFLKFQHRGQLHTAAITVAE